MEIDEKSLWDKKHSEGSHGSLVPDPFLPSAYGEFLSSGPPGSGLDVAGGVGRHAIWLAERGWRVKLVDISGVGIALARGNAAHSKAASAIITERRDLNTEPDLGR